MLEDEDNRLPRNTGVNYSLTKVHIPQERNRYLHWWENAKTRTINETFNMKFIVVLQGRTKLLIQKK
jgi:hypothetical protein